LHRKARGLGVWDVSVKPTLYTELLSLTRNILESAYPERSDRVHFTEHLGTRPEVSAAIGLRGSRP